MTARNRWDRIEELFSSVFELPPGERREVLETADVADRADVEALLDTHDTLTAGDDGFLEALDTDRARFLLERSGPETETPRTIGRYTVVRRLARGGMGIVYLAHDPGLDRPVAIKLLPPFLNADPAAVRGLAEEARTASSLDDPRIETVYEIGETHEGSVFIAMAYYDGETLRERIRRGPMALPEVVELGLQLAEGIDAAHRAGIIHRDVKPENILVTKDGDLKIVDFGVAKVLRDGLTTAGLFPGTAAYMSPEQTRGESVDGRSDVWSAGVVLYEMLAGERPFQGDGAALIHAIRHDAPADLAARRPDAPAWLTRAVDGCLEKEPARRPPSGSDLASSLRAARGETAGARATHWEKGRSLRFAAAGAAMLATLVVAGLLVRGPEAGGPAAVAEVPPTIAVLPFEVRGEELGIWREGMVDLLSIALDGATELRVADPRTVLARWREAVGESAQPDLERAFDVARRAGARYAVIGSVVSRPSGLRFGARVYSVADGSSLASFRAEGPGDSLFSLVDRLAIDILAATWQGEERPGREVDLSGITTSSPVALKAYLEGESLLRRADFTGAAAAYERAVGADSTFAFALSHLALAYGWLGDGARQDASYLRALRHAARLPEREVLLLRAIGATTAAHPPATIEMLRDVTRKYPDDPEAWYFLADRYWHDGEQVFASQEESERAFRRVVELDPGFAPAYIHLIHNAFSFRPDSARADSLMVVYERLAPTSSTNEENRIVFALAFGDSARRMEAYALFDTLPPHTGTEVASSLDHPRFWSIRETLLNRLRHRLRQQPVDAVGNHLLGLSRVAGALKQGRRQTTLEALADPVLFGGSRAAGFYRLYAVDLPLPRSMVDSALALPHPDSSPEGIQTLLAWFFAGAYAADQERWEEHASAVDQLSAEADRLLTQGDSARARYARGAVTALNGKALWVRGDVERALPLLLEGQRMATWAAIPSREALNESIRWWIGELLLESGRPGEALPYFESFWHDPLAAERLGPIYEELGDVARARGAYELVIFAWEDADPELQRRVRSAQAALDRLAVSAVD